MKAYQACLQAVVNPQRGTPNTTKGGSRRLEKSRKVWMIMMIAASLMWAGVAEKPKQSKMIFKNHQKDSEQLT